MKQQSHIRCSFSLFPKTPASVSLSQSTLGMCELKQIAPTFFVADSAMPRDASLQMRLTSSPRDARFFFKVPLLPNAALRRLPLLMYRFL